MPSTSVGVAVGAGQTVDNTSSFDEGVSGIGVEFLGDGGTLDNEAGATVAGGLRIASGPDLSTNNISLNNITINNAGTLTQSDGGSGSGMYFENATGIAINNLAGGVIQSLQTGGSDVDGRAISLDSGVNGATITNAGVISAANTSAWPASGAIHLNGATNVTIDNQAGGVIKATSTQGASSAIVLEAGWSGPTAPSNVTIDNAGSIIGGTGAGTLATIGLFALVDGQVSAATSASFQNVTIDNSGTIDAHGGIAIGALEDSAALTVTNSGTINGSIRFGSGANTLNSADGTITGTVNFGVGSATAILGAENNTVALSAGTHVVDGGGGTNTVSYANAASGVHVSLALQGQAQNSGVGTDTLSNFQAAVGSAYGDTLEGGGSASTTLTGGLGADTFVYRAGDGNVTVTDFSQGDKVDLSSIGAFTDLNDVLAASTQAGSDTVIAIGAGSLRLQNVSVGSLTASDFDFFAPATTVTGTSANKYTATFEGVRLQYTVGADGAAVTGGPESSSDALVNVQHIQFVDGYLDYSATDPAGQVYRLYEATLGRAPDQEGLTNWVNSLNSGTSLQSVVNGFVNSSEFQNTYGNLNNNDFVTLLYHNVLHRDPDSAGLTNWVGMLNSGQETRAQVVLGFSESQEDINASAPAVGQGLWVGNADAAEVARLYDAVFGRLPDLSGLTNWTNQMESGTSLQTVANGFVGSTEFQTAYGNLSNNDFVTLLYHNVLHRDPDSAGLTNWVANLNGGETRAQVVVGFSESAEHIANAAAHIDNGIWLT